MRCGKCGKDNRKGRRYCADCGSPLTAKCAQCGASNKPDEKFCGECGTALNAPAHTPEPETSPVQPREVPGERRHLTVLFCDLVGSTEVAAPTGPRGVARDGGGLPTRAAAEAVERFGGNVAKYLGDGVMAFFGYPEAHDNDAERAARAGPAIIDGVSKLNEQPGRPKLAARVGIDLLARNVGRDLVLPLITGPDP
jgi:class 3 adenylate cyclase